MNILAVCDGDNSSATTTMRNIAPYSKHNITICQWNVEANLKKDYDIIYLHYGGLLNPDSPPPANCLHKYMSSFKWMAGLLGPMSFMRWTGWTGTKFLNFVYELDGITVTSPGYYDLVKKIDNRLPVFVCHLGVDTGFFTPTPPPEEFCIGWAGLVKGESPYLTEFNNLPFPKKTVAVGTKTERQFNDMPDFYRSISVFVDNERTPCPGGLMFLEAAACGRPVVGFKSGILAEWIPPEYLAEDNDELVSIIKRLEGDRPLYLHECGRFLELALKYDWSRVAEEHDIAFEEVLKA